MLKKLSNLGIKQLPQLIHRTQQGFKKFFKYDLRAGFDEQELKDVYKVVERLPVIDVKYTIVAVDDKNEALEN